MITVRKLDIETFEMVVREATTTTHRVTLSPAYHAQLTAGRVSPEQLIEKSFEEEFRAAHRPVQTDLDR